MMAINHILGKSFSNDKPNPRYAYIAPTYRQAKAVAWDYLKQFAGSIPMVRFHETELRCDLPNGARIQLLGAENPDSLRGIYLDGVVLDEMADMPESLFPEIIRPALSDRKGWACFIGTPRGHNAFYELYAAAESQKDWHTALFRASDTDILDDEELEAARSMMSVDQYAQEYECSWVANVPGSVYGKELQEADDQNRITAVPHLKDHKVDTFWDLGMHDYTAIWFIQQVHRGVVHVIDFYQNQGEGLPHYIRELDQKGYVYGNHYGPHDLEVRELGTGKSRREAAYNLGLNFRVVPRLPLEDGIHAARMLIPRCHFDRDNCREGLEALRHYHRKYNERTRSFRDQPVHDWSSHAADAWRTAAIGLENVATKFSKPPQQMAVMDYNPFSHQGAA